MMRKLLRGMKRRAERLAAGEHAQTLAASSTPRGAHP
jgi:hypothetical protein